jgi:HK97 family phage prohead protease
MVRTRLVDTDLRRSMQASAARASQRADGDVVADGWDFEGWAVRYGVVDSYGTTFYQGCFTALGEMEALYPCLQMHHRDVVLGVLEAEDREGGLWIRGRWDATQVGQDARARARSGSAPGLSVGFVQYVAEDASWEDWQRIEFAELREVSQITLGMQAVPGAEMQAVRAVAEAVAEVVPDLAEAPAAVEVVDEVAPDVETVEVAPEPVEAEVMVDADVVDEGVDLGDLMDLVDTAIALSDLQDEAA